MDPVILSSIIGGALLFITMGKKKKSRAAPALPKEPSVPPAPDAPDASGQDATMLAELGYGSTTAGVQAFQYDFNFVQRAYDIWDRELVTDGIMGENTRGALIRAIAYAKNQGKSWEDIVKAAYAAQPKLQMTSNDKGNLQSLGYSVTNETIKQFQKDFNVTNLWFMDTKGDELLPISLMEDGLIGPNTREAIALAQTAQNKEGVNWRQLVEQARNA